MISRISKKNKIRATKAADLFALVASPTRILILSTLMKHKDVPVQGIAGEIGMTHSAVSHQLGLLAEARIVVSKKMGRRVCYRVAPGSEAKALVKFLSALM